MTEGVHRSFLVEFPQSSRFVLKVMVVVLVLIVDLVFRFRGEGS